MEQQCGHDMRELARQYAEGRFNKEEYRNRRRELIVRCSGEVPLPADILDVDDGEDSDAGIEERSMRIVRMLAITGIALLVLMGAVIGGLSR